MEWEWIFGVFVCVVMGKVELRLTKGETNVVGEVNGMDKISIGIDDSEGNINYMVDFLSRALPNPISEIGFEIGIDMSR